MHFKHGQKRVDYLGLDIMVPDWAKFVAADEDGEVSAFEQRPTKGLSARMWVPEDGRWSRLFEVEFAEGESWENSLQEVQEIGEVPCAQAYPVAKRHAELYGSGYMQVSMDGSVSVLDPTKIVFTIKTEE